MEKSRFSAVDVDDDFITKISQNRHIAIRLENPKFYWNDSIALWIVMLPMGSIDPKFYVFDKSLEWISTFEYSKQNDYKENENYIFVFNIYQNRDSINKGYGSACMIFLKELCSKESINRIDTAVSHDRSDENPEEDWKRRLHYFKKNGFESCREVIFPAGLPMRWEMLG